MTAIFLALAIASEVIATVALKPPRASPDPYPRRSSSSATASRSSCWRWCSSTSRVGTTYAIWSAVGTAAIALIGIAAYGETANVLKIASLGLIILGVVGLNAAGAH